MMVVADRDMYWSSMALRIGNEILRCSWHLEILLVVATEPSKSQKSPTIFLDMAANSFEHGLATAKHFDIITTATPSSRTTESADSTRSSSRMPWRKPSGSKSVASEADKKRSALCSRVVEIFRGLCFGF